MDEGHRETTTNKYQTIMTTKTRKPAVRKPPAKNPIKTEEATEFTIRPEFKYERHILKLLNTSGFYELWITRIPYTKNHEEAYESAEGFFQACFDKRRFANYDSFRNAVSHWLKNRK
jgi:hypothetical protein